MNQTTLLGDRRWTVLFVVFVATAIGIMGFASVFPLLPLWMHDFRISHSRAGLLTGIWYLMFSIIALPAGAASDRVELKKCLLAIWAVIVIGTALMAVAPSFRVLFWGRLLFSVGMSVHMVAAPKLLSVWFAARREFGLVMGIYSLSMTAGVYASLTLLGRVGDAAGWHRAMALLALLAVATWGLILLLPQTKRPVEKEDPSLFKEWLRPGVAAIVLAITYGGYNVATEAYLTIGPDYLVFLGFGVAASSALIGLYAWVALGLKPVLSSFLRKTNAAAYVVVSSLFFFASVLLLFHWSGFGLHLSVLLFGCSMALAMPAFYAMPPLLLGSEHSGRVFGLYQLAYGLGAVAQPLIGYTIDITGGYVVGYEAICGFGGLAFAGALWLVCFPPRLHRIPIDRPRFSTDSSNAPGDFY